LDTGNPVTISFLYGTKDSKINLIIRLKERLPDTSLDENSAWLAVAQQEDIKLSCPFCPNLFSAERSFQVLKKEKKSCLASFVMPKLATKRFRGKVEIYKIFQLGN
jgi:hypothetical protein